MRPLPFSLPRLGMGCAGIGNLYRPVSDAEAEATVAAALEAGIRYFDAAPFYGFGLSERRLGAALSGADVTISTKVGRLLEPAASPARERHGFVAGDPLEPVFDYSRDAVLRSHEESLKRLRRDRVDILLAHDLGSLTHGENADYHMRAFLDGGYQAMAELRDAGAVGAIGIGVNETEVAEELLERVDLDVVLLAGRYTLLDRQAADSFLPLAEAKGVHVIVGGPYNSGILATADRSNARYDYEAAPADILARADTLAALCATHGVDLPAAALQFPLRLPAVACVIPGLVGPAQVAETLARMDAAIPDTLWAALGSPLESM
jgi:D-threo-aldose 1-dehydrogenase